MSRNQKLRPLQPVYDAKKNVGALGTGNSSASFARASGGTIVTDTVSLVEHTILSSLVFLPLAPGSLTVAYDITGTASFDGHTTDGTTTITTPVNAIISSGSITVSYNPITDWVPA